MVPAQMLKTISSINLSKAPKWVAVTLLSIALIGFADAAFLTAEHFAGEIPPCTTGGCEQVLTSKYAEIAGIPLALAGAVYYLTIAILAFVRIENGSEKALRYAVYMTAIGFLVSLWLFYLQAFVILSYCQYCLVSGATSLLLFVVSVIAIRRYSSNQIHPQQL
jgi:uncharacterized membrane protein